MYMIGQRVSGYRGGSTTKVPIVSIAVVASVQRKAVRYRRKIMSGLRGPKPGAWSEEKFGEVVRGGWNALIRRCRIGENSYSTLP